MESYQTLDCDWVGKMEPSSPYSQDSSFAEEVILEDYDYCKEGLFNNALFDIIIEAKPVITSELMSDDLVLPIDPPSKVEKDQWLGEKLKLPPLAANYGLPATSIMAFAPDIGPLSHQQLPAKLANTEELLMEFDYVYENVELTHLTPPQTPPQEYGFDCHQNEQPQQQQQQPQQQQQQQQHQHQSTSFIPMPISQHQQQQQQAPVLVATDSEFYGFDTPLNGLLSNPLVTIAQQHNSPEPLQQVPGEYELADSFGFQPVEEVGAENMARGLEIVEQIVRSRSQDLPDSDDKEESFSETRSVPSPMSDSSSSSYCSSGYAADPDDEWSPSAGGNKKNSILRSAAGSGVVTKKRTRPYGRGIEDKKSRKKEQNKNAATRYRQKKKAEIEEILVVERDLKDKNEELRSKSADIAREIRYLKNLMREVCKAKGLI